MNYRRPSLRAALAAEYALGTLQGRARRRFERLMRDDLVLQREVEQWQNDLYPALIDALPRQSPPKRVWMNVAKKTRPRPRRSPFGWWRSVDFWRGWALAVSTALLALVLWTGLPPSWRLPGRADYVAVLQDRSHQPTWLVRVDRGRDQFRIETLRPQSRAADRSFELWLLPGANQPPQAVGLLPGRGTARLPLTPALAQDLARASGLAVSLEPAGGSPTGKPTGPVLYQGAMLAADKS